MGVFAILVPALIWRAVVLAALLWLVEQSHLQSARGPRLDDASMHAVMRLAMASLHLGRSDLAEPLNEIRVHLMKEFMRLNVHCLAKKDLVRAFKATQPYAACLLALGERIARRSSALSATWRRVAAP
jgi:hypothetical protein